MDKLLKAIGWFFLVWIGISIIARFFAALATLIGFVVGILYAYEKYKEYKKEEQTKQSTEEKI